jgi:hypothetical protein
MSLTNLLRSIANRKAPGRNASHTKKGPGRRHLQGPVKKAAKKTD